MGMIEIRRMCTEDVPAICVADMDTSDDNVIYLERQLENQKKGECIALLAMYKGHIAGFVFLYYKCKWGGMGNQGMPGIVDLKVFPAYRKCGIGSKLMDVAEEKAKECCDKIYLDVCLNSEYGPAQRLYIKRGYVPDGKGVYYEENVCATGAECRNDDELTLCLVKQLKRGE